MNQAKPNASELEELRALKEEVEQAVQAYPGARIAIDLPGSSLQWLFNREIELVKNKAE